jgi:hypothetical protein
LQALLILAEAGAVKMSYKLTPCAFKNYGRLCAEGFIDNKPLATHMITLKFASPYAPAETKLVFDETPDGYSEPIRLCVAKRGGAS